MLLFIDLTQEKHDEQESEGDHGSLVQLLGDDVRNERKDQSLLDPWTLRVLLPTDLDISNGLDGIHFNIKLHFFFTRRR